MYLLAAFCLSFDSVHFSIVENAALQVGIICLIVLIGIPFNLLDVCLGMNSENVFVMRVLGLISQ